MRRLGGLLAALACLTMTAAACSADGVSTAAAGRATTSTAPQAPIAFTVTSITVEATADPLPGTVEGARAGVESTLKLWLDEDVVGPLRSAQPAGDLRHVFSAATGERVATTADRAAFVSDGLPPVTGITAETATLVVVGLVDPDGQIPIVTVHLELKLKGQAAGSPLTVEHVGDVVLIPEGDRWRIDSYDLRATRDTPTAPATTTTAKS